MSTSGPAIPPPSNQRHSETRLCAFIFVFALLLNVGLSTIGLENTLIGGYGFRQLQTALTTQAFLQDGISLHYTTPVLGPPWEIPLEFPLFQATVAVFVRATGMSLDVAGRLVSWLYFMSALPACYLILGRFNLSAPRRWLILAFLLLSPVYLYFSRAFLMESAAVSFSCWFLYCFLRFLARPGAGSFVGAAAFGAMAGGIKVTTFAVFLVAALLLLIAEYRASAPAKRLRLVLLAGGAVAVPLGASVAWVIYTAAIRRLNPETALLEGHFGYWSFGDIALRLSPAYWLRTYRVWADMIVGESGMLLIAVYFLWIRGQREWQVIGCLAAFLSGQMIFANLYWVHAHYFYANGLFLTTAAGLCVCDILDRESMSPLRRTLFILALLGLQLSAYNRFIYPAQKDNTPVPEYVDALKELTDPKEIIVIIGQDWEAMVPYYAGRRGYMFMNGSENDSNAVRQRIKRLNPREVGAVIVQGPKWQDRGFADDALGPLHLGPRPLFVPLGQNLGIWVPSERQGRMRDEFDPHRFPTVQITPEDNTSGQPRQLLAREIGRRNAFDGFKPRPVRATTMSDFSRALVDGHVVLAAHAKSELFFRPPPNAHKLTALYGLAVEAYARADMSDGVEFTVSARQDDGTEQLLFHRFIDPARVLADQGIFTLDLTLPPLKGEVVLRTLGGPSGSVAYDWSYWGEVRIE